MAKAIVMKKKNGYFVFNSETKELFPFEDNRLAAFRFRAKINNTKYMR